MVISLIENGRIPFPSLSGYNPPRIKKNNNNNNNNNINNNNK
jgi:hypothetical protein